MPRQDWDFMLQGHGAFRFAANRSYARMTSLYLLVSCSASYSRNSTWFWEIYSQYFILCIYFRAQIMLV